ncbi:DUF6528 family protein [Sphingobacterium gobiense]|uniref:Lipoprotein n=1 Tax=Sphingobacterium gobiense TaxID=1382456 RepID=A0A2S9JS20_9SPHI|nr:DUF6528 family protein [Sphingobacterium gobiense]PRD56008.1 hypothetical protein C5749_01585 [Sphingobacterium gobiense]
MKTISSYLTFLLLLISCSGAAEPPVPPTGNGEEDQVQQPPKTVAECEQCIVISEQSDSQVAIADVRSNEVIWYWKPRESNVKPEHYAWFTNMSDAKPVFNGEYILATASGGGVALIRIRDKKTMFYVHVGGNTHSAEVLPDGNIVSASSTGNFLTVIGVDTLNFPENVYKKNIPIDFGHNVVWDRTNELLWSAARSEMKAFAYNFDCHRPDLELTEIITIPGIDAHDLFPKHDEDLLWLSMSKNIYLFDPRTKTTKPAEGPQASIKSISSGPASFPDIFLKPKEQWWSDEVVDSRGNAIFFKTGFRIYKARWFVKNAFSYPEKHLFKSCNK